MFRRDVLQAFAEWAFIRLIAGLTVLLLGLIAAFSIIWAAAVMGNEVHRGVWPLHDAVYDNPWNFHVSFVHSRGVVLPLLIVCVIALVSVRSFLRSLSPVLMDKATQNFRRSLQGQPYPAWPSDRLREHKTPFEAGQEEIRKTPFEVAREKSGRLVGVGPGPDRIYLDSRDPHIGGEGKRD